MGRLDMLIWITILIVIALSLLSGEFARTTEDFIMNHALSILLVALGMLYWLYIKRKRKGGDEL